MTPGFFVPSDEDFGLAFDSLSWPSPSPSPSPHFNSNHSTADGQNLERMTTQGFKEMDATREPELSEQYDASDQDLFDNCSCPLITALLNRDGIYKFMTPYEYFPFYLLCVKCDTQTRSRLKHANMVGDKLFKLLIF